MRLKLQTGSIRTVSAAAADAIRTAILDGELAPGDRLKEREIAQQLGISSTPVREALQSLDAEGLIELVPNRGATVRSYDEETLEEIYRLRALLEGHAAGQAAERITEAQLALLEESNERFAKLRTDDDLRSLVRENLVFHSLIIEAAGGAKLAELVQNVMHIPLIYRVFIWYSPEQKLLSEKYHRQLVAALRERDAARAEQVMQEHVLEARDVLARRLHAKHQNKQPPGA